MKNKIKLILLIGLNFLLYSSCNGSRTLMIEFGTGFNNDTVSIKLDELSLLQNEVISDDENKIISSSTITTHKIWLKNTKILIKKRHIKDSLELLKNYIPKNLYIKINSDSTKIHYKTINSKGIFIDYFENEEKAIRINTWVRKID